MKTTPDGCFEGKFRSPARPRPLATSLPLFVAFVLSASALSARDWIVHSETGADTNAGILASPLSTVQAAVDKAGPGDRVVLLPEKAVYRQNIDLSRAPTGLVLEGNGVTLDGEQERENGVFATGESRNIKIFRLSAIKHRRHGFSVTGESRGFQLFGISASANGVAGLTVGDHAECWIQGGNFSGNPVSLSTSDAAETYHTDNLFEGLITFEGGRHSLTNCTLVENPSFLLLSVRGSETDADGKGGAASLVIQRLSFTKTAGSKPSVEIGPGSFVYHDASSKDVLSGFTISIHPTSELRESLYHTYPIGRDSSGSPIMAWAGGGTRYLPSNAYRILHFGKHVPQEVATKISPDNDWLGLLAPLETAAFPPPGPAFAPENSSAHAIWRWIGLAAPDAVFVPDTPEGRALGDALSLHPPAGVGMVDVFITSEGGDGVQEMVVLPRQQEGIPSAKVEMLARVSRSPNEVLNQVAANYGDRFAGSYIEALAVLARAEGGLTHRASELAKAHLEAKPDLPKNGGEIAGTLLYSIIDESWARERVLAVADMAFDAEKHPLEAMPTHNEMSDAVFMGSPILAQAGRISGEPRYFDQALQNFRFIAGLCRRDDGIYRHSPLNEAAWGRGNGFPALGLALTLQVFPENHEGYGEMRDALVAHLQDLAAHQDNDGMWHQIIDHPDSYAELTATSMIAYAIATGLEKGWLESKDWGTRLDSAWAAVKMHVATDGRNFVNVCTGTGKQATLEDYYRREAILGPDGRGAAMVMMLASKMKKLGER
ncbi:MAG: glycoside hydrolase family 88 protein [Verrucomicrobiae bacterium]|nr:glycoside hydrolase family 88 protein [Verrucomicrobiae bacterium]